MYEQYQRVATGKISLWVDPASGHLESYNNSRQEYLEKLSDFIETFFPEDTEDTVSD